MTADKDSTKPIKKKGPIRIEAIIPMILVGVLIYLYTFFFLDSHVKRIIEIAGLYSYRAEINVGSVNLSFWGASFMLNDLEVTDRNKPTHNSIEVGKIKFDLSWDALLRAKFVVENSEVSNIQIGSERSSEGRVLPKSKTAQAAGQQLSDAALEATAEEYDGNILGDTARILGGVKPEDQVKNIENDLKSSGRLKELEDELKVKEKAWQERIKKLPKNEDLKALETKFKGIKTDKFKNPKEVQNSIKQFKAVIKEADTKLKDVKSAGKDFDKDMKTYKAAFKDLEKMVQKDIDDIEKRLKIPKLDSQNITQMLFAKLVLNKMGDLQKWMNMAREYMPPKKSKEEKAEAKAEQLTPRQRALGKTYTFATKKSYPLFWLKKGTISSKSTDSDLSGDLSGSLKDFTSNPALLGKPAIVEVAGDFPKQKIFGVKAKVTIDHTTDEPVEYLDLFVQKVPVSGMVLSDSEDVKFALNSADSQTTAKGTLKGQTINLDATTVFSNIAYEKTAKSKVLQDVLDGVAKDLPKFDLRTRVTGSFEKFNLRMRSGLGKALQNALKKQLDLQIKKARDKIKKLVDGKIKGQKDKLDAQLKGLEKKLGVSLKDKEKQIDATKGKINKAKDKATNSQKKKVEKEGKKLLKDLKKKFKF